MHLTYMRLENVGPHVQFERRFEPGLIGIFGPNGSGKSTILKAAYGALTGDFRRFPGTKQSLVRDTARPEDRSCIEVDYVHEGTEFSLLRSLRPARQRLKVAGRTITADAEIASELQQILGVPAALLREHVFVDQWQIFSVLFQTPEKRAEAFRSLCRTERAATIDELCQKALRALPAAESFVDDSAETLSRLKTLRKRAAELLRERKAASSGLLSKARLEELESRLEQLAAHRERKLRRRTCRQAFREAEAEHRRISGEQTEAAEILAAAEARLAAVETQAAEVERKAAAAAEYAEIEEARDAARRSLDAAVLPELPPLHPRNAEFADLHLRLQEMAGILHPLETLLERQKRLDRLESAECPTCGQPLPHYSEEQRAQQEQVRQTALGVKQETEKLLKEIEQQSKKQAEVQKQRARTLGARNELQRTLERRQAELDALRRPEPPTAEELGLPAEREKLRTARDKAAKALQKAQRETAVAEAGLVAARKAWRQVKREIGEVPEGDVAELRQARKSHYEAARLRATLRARRTEVLDSYAERKEHLAQLRRKLAERDAAGETGRILEGVRELFHWRRLPQMVARYNLRRVEQDLNAQLELFGTPFRASATDDLSFELTSPGRPPYPVEQLSGGQRVVFATALRIALNGLFGSDLGMMALDEPTAGLDEDNLAYMRDVFEMLSRRLKDRRQLLVVTHETSLRNVFDQVVVLPS